MLIERIENLYKICRLCLNNGLTLKSLFHLNQDTTNNDDLLDKISICLNIEIREDDKFSKLICETCINNVENFYEFWTNSNQAQKLLEKFSNNCMKKEENEDELLTTEIKEETFVNVDNEQEDNKKNCIADSSHSSCDEVETQSLKDVDPLADTDEAPIPEVLQTVNPSKITPTPLNDQSSVINAQNTIKSIPSTQSKKMYLLIRTNFNTDQSTNQTQSVIRNSITENSINNSIQNVTIVNSVPGTLNNQHSTSYNNGNVTNPLYNSNLITCVLKDNFTDNINSVKNLKGGLDIRQSTGYNNGNVDDYFRSSNLIACVLKDNFISNTNSVKNLAGSLDTRQSTGYTIRNVDNSFRNSNLITCVLKDNFISNTNSVKNVTESLNTQQSTGYNNGNVDDSFRNSNLITCVLKDNFISNTNSVKNMAGSLNTQQSTIYNKENMDTAPHRSNLITCALKDNFVSSINNVKNVAGSLSTTQQSTSYNEGNMDEPRVNNNLITCVLKDNFGSNINSVKNVAESLSTQQSTSYNDVKVDDPHGDSNLITCVLKDKNSVETTYTVDIRTLNYKTSQKEEEKKSTTQETKEEIKCEFCGKLFPHKCRLEAHRRKHTGDKPFKCDTEGCNKRFASKTSVALHKKFSHSNERPYNCQICHKSFKRITGFNMHLKIHGDQKNYHCDLCKYSTFTFWMLNQHKKTHTDLYKYICEFCGKGFLQENDFFKHRLIHNRVYGCNNCGEKFKDLLKLREHRKHVHKKIYYPANCPICNKVVKDRSIKQHIRRMHKTHSFQCYYCKVKVTNRTAMICHLKQHTSEQTLKLRQVVQRKKTKRRYVCKICNKKYSQKSNLNSHKKKVHLPCDKNLSLKCNECGIITSNKISLEIHKNNTHNKNIYRCNECGIEFKNKSSIIIHLRKHNGYKPYECPDCKQCFIASKKLKLHQLKHIPFIDTELDLSFMQSQLIDDDDYIEVCEPTIIKKESNI